MSKNDDWFDAVPKPPTPEELPDSVVALESEWHRRQIELLVDPLETHWAGREDMWVAGTTPLIFSVEQFEENLFRAPDVMIALDTTPGERAAWVTWMEGGKTPELIVELVSEETASSDWGEKKHLCANVLRVPYYILYDPSDQTLDGFRLAAGGMDYEPMEITEAGTVSVPRLGLHLGLWQGDIGGIDGSWLRWGTPEGEVLPTAAEASKQAIRRAKEAEDRALQAERKLRLEADARKRAEARVAELRARLAELEAGS